MSQSSLRLVENSSMDKDKSKALDAALSQIERSFGKGSIMRLGKNQKPMEIEVVSTGFARPRYRAGRRRTAARPHHRDLRAGIVGQDDAGPAHHCGSPEEGRRLRLRRRRACARSRLCPQARRQPRRSADLPARYRRAGARDLRYPGALRRHRRAGHRLGGGADAEGRTRRRNGRRAAGPPGPPHEPGPAQAHRLDLAVEDHGGLHQPDPHENRRHVRQPGDDDGRQRAEVLRLRAPRHPPRLDAEGPRRSDRQLGRA